MSEDDRYFMDQQRIRSIDQLKADNDRLKARIAELEAMGREAVEDEAKSNKGVRIALCELDRMEARIAKLESRPDPPAPAAIDPDMPRRFRHTCPSGERRYGIYWMSKDRYELESGDFGNGRPDECPFYRKKNVEWIDAAPTTKEVKPCV